jgi:hypothetical protein
MHSLRFRSLLLVTVGLVCASSGVAGATVVPFTEDFDNGPSQWFNADGTALLDWVAAGGPDGGAYVTTLFEVPDPLPPFGSTLFRGQDEYGSSGGAFEGNWIADGVTEFSYWIRHDAPVPLQAFVRFASPVNFPGAAGLSMGLVAPDTWTEVTVAIDPDNPLIILEGVSFEDTFSNIGHLQIGLIATGDLIGETLTVDLDKVSIVPAPGGLALLLLAACRRRRRRAVASASLLAAAVAVPAVARPVDVVFDEPTLDRWMYPFNGTPGTREFAAIFAPLTDAGFDPLFDNRDGEMILGFDTSPFIEPGLGPGAYTVTAATVTVMVVEDQTFAYDPTPDPYTSWLDVDDPEYAPDPDLGRAVELFGAGFRCGHTALSFAENGPYCDGCNCLTGCKQERCVYPIDFDEGCQPRDISNNVDERFDPVPWAVGTNAALTQGQPVPIDTELTFEIDVCDPCVRAYFAEALDAGMLDVVIASIFPSQPQQGGTFPKLYTKENLLVELGLASAARLEMSVTLGPLGDLDGDGQVSTSDLLAMLGAWGPCDETCPADLDCNGTVSTSDLLILLGNWG